MSAKDAMKAQMDALMGSFRCCVFPYVLCSASTVARHWVVLPLSRPAFDGWTIVQATHTYARTCTHTHNHPHLEWPETKSARKRTPTGRRAGKPTMYATG